MTEILLKEKILQFISSNPGSYLRKIQNNIECSIGAIQYNLKILEKEKKIKSVKTNFYKNYYPVHESNEQILAILNLDSPRKIILFLIQNGPTTHKNLTKEMALSSSTISWHMKKLLDLQIVTVQYNGKYTVYCLNNKSQILKCLVKCASLREKIVIAKLDRG